jgi:peroxiredoxin
MQSLPSLAALLARVRADRPHWEDAYSAMVEGLHASGAGRDAPRAGAAMPDFALPDQHGHWRHLSDLIADGPIVLSFQRGGWCPFCRAELSRWRAALPALATVGARLVLVTPETGGRAASLAAETGGVRVLVDVDHGVGMALGLTVPLAAAVASRYRGEGLDLDRLTGGAGRFVPIPATYAIGADGIIRFAHVDPDFRVRAEPAEVVASFH